MIIIIIVITIVILFFCAGGYLFSRTNKKDSSMEIQSSKTEPRETEMPIETKPQPSTNSHSRYIHASFDTVEDE